MKSNSILSGTFIDYDTYIKNLSEMSNTNIDELKKNSTLKSIFEDVARNDDDQRDTAYTPKTGKDLMNLFTQSLNLIKCKISEFGLQKINAFNSDGERITLYMDNEGTIAKKQDNDAESHFKPIKYYQYDDNGNIITIASKYNKSDISINVYTYDDKNRPLIEREDDGSQTIHSYNDEENSSTITRKNPFDNIVDTEKTFYDDQGRPIKRELYNPDDNLVVYEEISYDLEGNLTPKFYNANGEEIDESTYILSRHSLSADGFL